MSRTIKQKKKAIAKSCRNNGSCPYCQGNRMHKHKKRMERCSSMLKLAIKIREDQE